MMNEPERLLDREAIAERLCLSPVTVGHMLRAGKLPGLKLGGVWRVRSRDLDEYIRQLSEAAVAPRAERLATAKNRHGTS